MSKQITITCSDVQAELFTTQFILDRIEAGASGHTLTVGSWSENGERVTQVSHSRLGVTIQTKDVS